MKAFSIKITIYEVREHQGFPVSFLVEEFTKNSESQFHWEISRMFEQLGEIVISKIDPQSNHPTE